MITEEQIKEMVSDEFTRNLLNINEFTVCSTTLNMPKQELRTLVVFNELILSWIRQVVNSDQGVTTPELKLQIIREIFNSIDEMEEN